ncbi:hypothetical protein HHI36_022317 [Cryptolaemus montrouzieri]|uniref:Uncharacterized protein n=1 Tax=Cryptolaemus montrouzieri TaxID=559131 RepID=A0ABD2MZU6_9CUCU
MHESCSGARTQLCVTNSTSLKWNKVGGNCHRNKFSHPSGCFGWGGLDENFVPKVKEIDESKFFQRKYHRIQLREGHWVFSGIDSGTERSVLVEVTHRSADTLSAIIEEEVCEQNLIDNAEPIGGLDENFVPKVTEIDESKFFHQKYHRGQWRDWHWVFSGIESGTGRCLVVELPYSTADTLSAIIEEQYLTYGWSKDRTQNDIDFEANLTHSCYNRLVFFFREVCEQNLIDNAEPLGGLNEKFVPKVMEIDESKFFHQKYHRYPFRFTVSYLREVCEQNLIDNAEPLAGLNEKFVPKVMEIDESKFFHRKYHRVDVVTALVV